VETSTDDKLRLAAKAIKATDALLVTAGAGMGVDSGLPDFRGTKVFWRAYPIIAKLGLSFEEMTKPGWFIPELRGDPDLNSINEGVTVGEVIYHAVLRTALRRIRRSLREAV